MSETVYLFIFPSPLTGQENRREFAPVKGAGAGWPGKSTPVITGKFGILWHMDLITTRSPTTSEAYAGPENYTKR